MSCAILFLVARIATDLASLHYERTANGKKKHEEILDVKVQVHPENSGPYFRTVDSFLSFLVRLGKLKLINAHQTDICTWGR